MSTAVYCTVADIQNRLSTAGALLRIDDSPPTSYGDVIDDASAEIEMYCLLRYSAVDLANSRWVKHKCADIATYLLCERRGNVAGPGIANKFERAVNELGRIQMGNLPISDIPELRIAVPMVSNMRAALRPYPHAVVEPKRSTDTVQHLPKKNQDPWDSTNFLPDFVI